MTRTPSRRLVVPALLAVLAVASACTGTSGEDTTVPSVMPPTSAPTTTTTVASTPPETTPEPEPLPTVPDEYASAAFDAWVAGDDAVLERMLAPEALEDLRQVNADPSADWEFSRCEGAAGSSYCEWIGPDGALTFRVANEAASNGEDHAIAEVITTGG